MSRDELRLFEYIVISILSVNNFPLYKTVGIVKGLTEKEILDPSIVLGLTDEEIISRLAEAGYNRGTAILAQRIKNVSLIAKENGLAELLTLLYSDDEGSVESWLLKLHGVGPAVVANFWALQERSK